jgi:rubrerythrin
MSDEARHNDQEPREQERHPDPPPAPEPEEISEPVCAVCGHPISQDDLVCPNCGTSLAAG